MWQQTVIPVVAALIAGFIGFRLGLARGDKQNQIQLAHQARDEWNNLVEAIRNDVLAWIDNPDINQPVDFTRHDRFITQMHAGDVLNELNAHISAYREACADVPELLESREDAEKFTQATATATTSLEQLKSLLIYRD